MQEYKKVIKSMIGGTTSTMIYLSISYILDFFINVNVSTSIALIIGSICNYYFQQKAIVDTSILSIKYGYKFIISDFFVLGSNLYGSSYLLNRKKDIVSYFEKIYQNIHNYKEYYNILIRLSVTMITFFAVSFPLRRYWVFSN